MRLNCYQYAYVTRNLERAMETLQRDHGVGDYMRYDPDMEVRTPAGVGRAQVRVAMVWDGLAQIELIEPVGGMVDHYLPYLPGDDGMRFHHSAARVDDWDALQAQIAQGGWTIAYEGALDGLKFVYIDTRKTLGHYLEYIWIAPEWVTALGFPAGL